MQTYGLEMKDVFLDEDLAIGTYRFAVGTLIPDLTRGAARSHTDTLVYTFTRQDFEKEYGTKYQRPGFFARFIVLLAKITPRIGPFRTLSFDPPTPEAERLFLESFAEARTRYRGLLDTVRANRLNLQNLDFDTGRRPGAASTRSPMTPTPTWSRHLRTGKTSPTRCARTSTGFTEGRHYPRGRRTVPRGTCCFPRTRIPADSMSDGARRCTPASRAP